MNRRFSWTILAAGVTAGALLFAQEPPPPPAGGAAAAVRAVVEAVARQARVALGVVVGSLEEARTSSPNSSVRSHPRTSS